MEVYFSVSLFGSFVFRTDLFLNSKSDADRAEHLLRERFTAADGFRVTRNERPAVWTSNVVS